MVVLVMNLWLLVMEQQICFVVAGLERGGQFVVARICALGHACLKRLARANWRNRKPLAPLLALLDALLLLAPLLGGHATDQIFDMLRAQFVCVTCSENV